MSEPLENLKDLYAKFKQAYEKYVEEYAGKYSKNVCPLCKLVDKDEIVPPEMADSFGWTCPLCGREEYWAF